MKPLNFNYRRQVWTVEEKQPSGRWHAIAAERNIGDAVKFCRLFKHNRPITGKCRVIRYLPQGTKG